MRNTFLKYTKYEISVTKLQERVWITGTPVMSMYGL